MIPSTCSTAECAKGTRPPDLTTVASVTGNHFSYHSMPLQSLLLFFIKAIQYHITSIYNIFSVIY